MNIGEDPIGLMTHFSKEALDASAKSGEFTYNS